MKIIFFAMQNGAEHINLRCILYVTRTKLKIYPINVEFTRKKPFEFRNSLKFFSTKTRKQQQQQQYQTFHSGEC